MSASGRDPDDPGSTTGVGGTPVAVDVRGDRRSRVVLAALVGGPVVWFAHFMVVYLAVEAGCTGGGDGLARLDPPVPDVITLVATGLAGAACLALAGWGLRRWRSTPASATGEADRDGSLAFIGALLSLLSFVTILLVGLPAVALPAC